MAPLAEVLAGYGRGRFSITTPTIRLGRPATAQAFVVAPGADVGIYVVPRVDRRRNRESRIPGQMPGRAPLPLVLFMAARARKT